jgi:hypothetical protein
MSREGAVGLLRDSWQGYLEARGHQVHGKAVGAGWGLGVLRSHSGKTGYRWLLRVSEGPMLRLGAANRAGVRRELQEARRAKEQTYLVAGFLRDPPRIVVIPALAAVKAGCVRCDRGGIAWDDQASQPAGSA